MLALKLLSEKLVAPTFTPALQVLDVDVFTQRLYDSAPFTAAQLTVAAVAEVTAAARLPGVPQGVPLPPPLLDCVVNVVVAYPEFRPEQEAATRTSYAVEAVNPFRVKLVPPIFMVLLQVVAPDFL